MPGSLRISGSPDGDGGRRGASTTNLTGNTGGDCSRPRESASSRVAQRCLHGSPCGLKYGQVHEASSLEPAQPHAHPVLRRPAHPGHDLAGPGRHHGHPPLDEIRLAPRPDRVAEIPRDFLGDPHHRSVRPFSVIRGHGPLATVAGSPSAMSSAFSWSSRPTVIAKPQRIHRVVMVGVRLGLALPDGVDGIRPAPGPNAATRRGSQTDEGPTETRTIKRRGS